MKGKGMSLLPFAPSSFMVISKSFDPIRLFVPTRGAPGTGKVRCLAIIRFFCW